MTTPNARIRQRLGAEIARLRAGQGMPKQPQLAEAARIGLRTVVAVERGDKVSSKTMRKIENALNLPTGSTDDYVNGKIDELAPMHTADSPYLYAREIRDEFEDQMMKLRSLPEDERWAGIFERRERLHQEGDRQALPMRRPGK